MNALIWLLIGWLLGRGAKDLTTWGPPTETPPQPETPPTGWPGTKPPVQTTPPQNVPTSTPPWPQSVPPGLPPFPSGWEPDQPVGSGVAARAFALLPELWTYGPGTRKTEQTNGRWITYVATPMGSKKGVVAYRLKAGAIPASTSPAPAGTVPASASYATAAPATSLRTLRRGSSGGDVEALQRLLGIGADGKFGPGTESAVKAFQASRGLVADGIVGPKTWSALTGR